MKFEVYILFSSNRGKYYVGQTSDLKQRLNRHNSGKVKSTKSGMPWNLKFATTVDTRSEAMLLEQKIKKRGAERFLAYIGM